MSDPTVPWLAAAFIVVWLILGVYLVRLHRAQRHLDRRLSELQRARDGAGDLGATASQQRSADLPDQGKASERSVPNTDKD